MDDIIPIAKHELNIDGLEVLDLEDQIMSILYSRILKDLRNLGIKAKVGINGLMGVKIKFRNEEDLNLYKLAGNLKSGEQVIFIQDKRNVYKHHVVFSI